MAFFGGKDVIDEINTLKEDTAKVVRDLSNLTVKLASQGKAQTSETAEKVREKMKSLGEAVPSITDPLTLGLVALGIGVIFAGMMFYRRSEG